MKKTFLSIFLLAILVGSCGDKSSKNSNTHTHEDGTEHVNHDTTMEKAPEQEEIGRASWRVTVYI